MNNQMDMIKSMMKQNTPQDIVQKMVANNNPMVANLLQMARKGDNVGIENFARNLCKERGVDFDREFANFMNNFK